MVGERMEAEDVCHEVFLEALRRGTDYDPARCSIKAWLAVKMRSRCLDRLRRNQRVQPLEGEFLPGGPRVSEEDQVISRLEKEALRSAVYALPETQRKAILGSYYTLHTHKKMSEAWNVPIVTVKSWVRYGLANLRKQLEKQGWSHSPEGGGKDERFRL
ncbi:MULTISPECIES: RNA polymerase sigma factor [Paenibacillus]|uniref:RNA polymerase sigma factor n=1 Tax=Paenibacillus TaxID=44249 RepID=UPI002FDFE2C2